VGDGRAAETGAGPAPELLLDRQLGEFDAGQMNAVLVDAPVDETYRAVRALDPDQVARSVPFMRLMGAVRGLPAGIAARVRRETRSAPETLSADEYREAFVLLDEKPGVEFVVGMIGKFMTATQLEFRRFAPHEFASFDAPGFGKVALNFLVQPYGTDRSLLTTETRTATTDPVSRARFQRYWRVIGPFAGMIMRRWVTLAKLNAEQAATVPRNAT
jgi:hypothetical protein